MNRDMLLSDIHYGHIYLFELTTGHSDQCANQRREAAGYTQRYQRCETLWTEDI
jgi:hypothetical protein